MGVVTIDARDKTPIYAQLERGLRAAIAAGRLSAGDQLPTVRQLAVELRINANTVARVYSDLERAGVIETQARRRIVHRGDAGAGAIAAGARTAPARVRHAGDGRCRRRRLQPRRSGGRPDLAQGRRVMASIRRNIGGNDWMSRCRG